MPSSGFSSGEMLRMQQDAIQRVREMQRRSNEKISQEAPPAPANATPQGHSQPPSPAPPPPAQHREAPHPRAGHSTPAQGHSPPAGFPFNLLQSLFPSSQQQNTQPGLLARLGIDEEQAFLLLLILMLLREGADQKLILALCYLLL